MGYYLLLINALGLLLMCLDKHYARKHLWRIPEAVLLGTAFLGGSAGALLGMLLAHHKTRKPKFLICVPLFLAVQIFLLFRFGR